MSAATAAPLGARMETTRKQGASKRKYQPLADVEIRFASVVIIVFIYMQIVVNQNISASIKGLFLLFATVTLVAFFWDTLEKVAYKWWDRSFIGYNTLYYLDPHDKSLKEITVPRFQVFSTEIPKGVLAVSVPLGGFLNNACVFTEYQEISNLWRVRKRTDMTQARLQYVRLVDQFNDSVSLSIDKALLFLESKQESLEFFPNWENVFLEMRELIASLNEQLSAHQKECCEEHVNALKAEIEKFNQERQELKEAQRKMFVTIHKSIRMLSEARPSVTSDHILALIELLIKELMARVPRPSENEESTAA